MSETKPKQDEQSVDAAWERVATGIAGVCLKRLRPVLDERGEIQELYRVSWGVHDSPVVQVYQTSLWPGKAKGFIMHKLQDDRICVTFGVLRWVLYDDRPDSPTRGVLSVHTLGERCRMLLTIPAGVWHAVQNVGTVEGVFINLPTREYCYTDPDKFRLPLENDLIPFSFDEPIGR